MNDPNQIDIRHTQLIIEPSVDFDFDLVESSTAPPNCPDTAEALLRLIDWLDTGTRLRTTGVKVAAVQAYLANKNIATAGRAHGVSKAMMNWWAVRFRKHFGIMHAANTRTLATCEASRRAALRRHAERKAAMTGVLS